MIVKRDRGGEGLGRSFTSRLMRPRGYIRGRRQIETYESRGAEEARERNFVMREYERKRAEHPQHPYHWRINVHPAIVHLRLISSRRLTVRRGSYRGHANIANERKLTKLVCRSKSKGHEERSLCYPPCQNEGTRGVDFGGSRKKEGEGRACSSNKFPK